MNKLVYKAPDIRESKEWADYLSRIGWQIEKVGGANLFIKNIPLINKKFIKIQHPSSKINIKKIDKYASEKSATLIIEPHNANYDKNELERLGFKKSKWHYAPSATIRIDLSNKELFSSFSENAKRNIKKALKNNLKIRIIDMKKEKDMKHFEIYFKLLKELRNQKGFYAPGYGESLKKMHAFKNNSVFLFAYHNNEPIAVIWLASFKNMVCYMQTGVTKKGYKLLANYLLVWSGLNWATKNKFKVFDFESIYDPRNPSEHKGWIGYTEFKRRFHGEEIYYPESWIKFNSKLLKGLFIISSLAQIKKDKIYPSRINKEIKLGKSYRKKAVLVNGIPQSGGELGYMRTKIIKDLNIKKVKKILVLGVGAGDVIGEIQNKYPNSLITAVEIDPSMINIAREEFNLSDKNLKIIIDDANNYINKTKSKFDLIICDIFIGAKNPTMFRTEKFIEKLKIKTNNNGVVIYNSHFTEEDLGELKDLICIFENRFNSVKEVFGYKRNKVFLLRSL